MSGVNEKTGLNEATPDSKKCTVYMPKRIIVVGLACLGMLVIHAMRVNLAITVVTILDENPHAKVGTDHARASLPQVNWNSRMIGFLHCIFYVGFIITQVPGGVFAFKVSGHRIFGLSILCSSGLNLILPTAISQWGFACTCTVRFLQGLAEGLAIPAVYKVLRDWSPECSVTKYGGWVFAGMYAGPIIGFPIDGAITHYSNWKVVFYGHGASGILWYIFWVILIYKSPSDHPSISKEEKELINGSKNGVSKDSECNIKFPWKEIFVSKPFWAIMVCHFVKSWMFCLMLTNEPTYLNQFHFTLLENGIYSSLPHILKVFTTLTSGYLADMTLEKYAKSRTLVRKLMTGVGFLTEALCCFILSFVWRGHVAVGVISIGIGVSGIAVSGWQINHLDLAPDLASILAGISAAFGTIGGIMSPAIIGIITHPQTLPNWQNAFLVNANVITFGALFYLVFGSGEIQPWSTAGESTPLTSNQSASEKPEETKEDDL